MLYDANGPAMASTPVRFAVTAMWLTAAACGAKDKDSCDAACDAASTAGSVSSAGAPASQDLPPLPGAGPTFSAITDDSYTVSWEQAADDHTAAAGLAYQVVAAAVPADLSTIAQAAAATADAIVLPWTEAALSAAVTGRPANEARAYGILVRDSSGSLALYPAQSVTTLVQGAPTTGTGLTVTSVTSSGFTVSWGAATNPGDTSLSYRAVWAATLSEVDTVAEASAIPDTAATAWLPASTSAVVTGLTANTRYAVAVLVKNSAGGMALYAPVSRATYPKRLFVTSTRVPGNLTSVAVADAYCLTDSARPAGAAVYKALIAMSGRTACTTSNCNGGGASEHQDWPLAANTTYGRADGLAVATTNANGLLPTALTYPIAGVTNYSVAWSGLNSDWRSNTSDNCANWSNGTNGQLGVIFNLTASAAGTWNGINLNICSANNALVCAEQ